MRCSSTLLLFVALALGACSGGNIRSVSSYTAPAAPTVRHPSYDPFASPGSANATWAPPVVNRNGTIVRPHDPGVLAGRPDYERAPGAAGGSTAAPPGTF